MPLLWLDGSRGRGGGDYYGDCTVMPGAERCMSPRDTWALPCGGRGGREGEREPGGEAQVRERQMQGYGRDGEGSRHLLQVVEEVFVVRDAVEHLRGYGCKWGAHVWQGG